MTALVRIYLLGVLCIFFHGFVPAQDFISRILSDSLEFSRIQHPKKSWLKFDMVPLIRDIENGQVEGIVGAIYEQKVGLSWSVLGEVHRYYSWAWSGNTRPSPNGSRMIIGLGARYFPAAKSRITSGHQANNLIGSYFGLKAQSRLNNPFADPSQGIPSSYWHSRQLSFSLLYGTQRQIWRIGFFDFSFGLQLAYGEPGYARFVFPSYIEEGWQIFPVGQLRFGLGL